ncbi:MAG: serine acetyltransferase [Muribaculaceae bacterium]|nr:serine acetyltransferase [Muribaculaceae bacterium]
MFVEMPEVRSVVYYRLKRRYRLLPSLILPGQTNCYICAEAAGGGLKLIHGFSTIIYAKSIGENCTVFQQVTIGYSKGATPTVGDNCVICCGAKILGNVSIGNNVIIGANAVVTRDVPDNSIVAGTPAKVISTLPEGQNPLDLI